MQLPDSVSIDEALRLASKELHQSPTPLLDAQVLLCFAMKCERSHLFTWPERLLTATQIEHFGQLIAARASGHPVAHLVGEREFWSLPIQVDNSTLIPRPDTEVLVETALQLALPQLAQVLDLGTGTGAIALALKHEKPAWKVFAVDQSPAAVALAQRNATALKIPISCLQSDWFSAMVPSCQFDLIVSNPPYIDASDAHLEQGDVRFEPHSALIADHQGMADIDYICQQAPQYMKPNAWLLLEHGWQQGAKVRQQLQQCGFSNIQSVRDYANLERVSLGQWQPSQ